MAARARVAHLADALDADALLRTRARERIRQGTLPRAQPARTWGGPGSGAGCDLCDTPIPPHEPEFELQLDLAEPGRLLRFHRQCHAAWEAARREFEPGGWTQVSDALPPEGTVVEARLSLGAPRNIILDVQVVRERDAPPLWLNVTTREPLPKGWEPVEWRLRPVRSEVPASPASASVSRRA